MKRIILALGFSVAALCSVTALAANPEQIGVVDMKQVIQNSPQVGDINKALKKEFSGRKDKIVAMTQQLQKELQSYQKNKAVMNAKQMAELKGKITKQEMTLRDAQIKYQQDLYAAQSKEMNSFVSKLRNVVKTIAAEKKLTLVLPKNAVLYAKGDVDITNNVQSALK